MKYIAIIIATLIISSCGVKLVRPWVVSEGNTNHSPTAPAQDFSAIDLDKSGGISKAEYEVRTSAVPEIDISTPVMVFVWVIVLVLIICILSVAIPRGFHYLKNRQSAKECRTDEDSEHTLLNE